MDFFHFTFYTLMLLVITGGIVGFLLALTGGGGSIVCVPLLLYMVQIPDTHLVIGTSAMSVAVSALLNLLRTPPKETSGGEPALSCRWSRWQERWQVHRWEKSRTGAI